MIDAGWLGKDVNSYGCPKVKSEDNRRIVEECKKEPLLFILENGKEIPLGRQRKVGFLG